MTEYSTTGGPGSSPPAEESLTNSRGLVSKARIIWRWIASLATRLWAAVRPGPRAWRGAALGILALMLVYLTALIVTSLAPTSPPLAVATITLTLLLGSVLIGGVLSFFSVLVARLPLAFRWILLASLPLLILLGLMLGVLGMLASVVGTIGTGALVGAGIGAVRPPGFAEATRVQRIIALSGLTVGTVALVTGLFWLMNDGSPAEAIPNAAADAGVPVAGPDLPDPSQPGPYEVHYLTYGNGRDRHRPEFGTEADLTTDPVDGTPFVDGWDSYVGWFRDRFWGFSLDSLPLNGRVWHPEGEGPFPLVLIVHGNHQAEDFSDPGYAYLGELMASRGFIFVSVDENFLNSAPIDLFKGLETENDARGWLLLEHLRTWAEWNDSPGNPFHGKVDLENIGLIGHSRGGEAVSEAAAFNRLSRYPDDATVAFDFGFQIRAVIAIAPVDDQYSPTGRPTPVRDVNYLVLHGSLDSDVTSFDGLGTYERVQFTEGGDWFKAALYIHGANHGQFNTGWGRSDVGAFFGQFLNQEQLLPAQEQERIAKVFIGAFLEASLNGARGYRHLFQDPRSGSRWLPETVYLARYEAAGDVNIATFEEDIEVTTATLPGAHIESANLTLWREELVKGKWDQSLSTSAVFAGWEASESGDTASYSIVLAEGLVQTESNTRIVFGMADANEDPDPDDEDEEEADREEGEEEDQDEPREPIDLTVEVWDASGATARLPLSHVSLLQPQIEVELYKAEFMGRGPSSEIVLQSFEFSLSAFEEANAAFDPTALAGIRFVFDRTEEGVVVLDGVALRG